MNRTVNPSKIVIPRWTKRIPALHDMYWNPVFQRRIIRNMLEIGVTRRGAFIAGLVIVFLLSFATFIIPQVKMIISLILVGIAVLIIIVRTTGSALVSTARGMRNIMAEDMKDPVLTTPVTNASIYYGVTLGTLMRARMIVESMFSFIFGLLVAFLGMAFVKLALFGFGELEIWLISIPWLIYFAALSIGTFILGMLIMLLVSFASGLYATFLDPLTSVIMSIVHLAFCVGFGAAFLYIPFLLRDYSTMLQGEVVRGLSFGGLFMIGWIALAVIGTAWSGVFSLARNRTPGFYEPDEITAAEHVHRGI